MLHFQNLLQEPRSETFTKSEVNFHLYTRNNELDSELIPGLDFENLMSSNYFNATKNTTFIIHGWNNNYKSPLNTLIKPVLLRHYDINVFVVDWSGPANKFYSTSVSVVPIVGEFVGSFVNFIIDYFGCTPDQFSFVGHSLGAHVSGKAGKVVKEYYGPVDFIVGLDPASPLFTVKDTEKRLDTSDANFVHIIHTNGGKLGFKSSIGHADYFPNGGSSQPGCGLDIFGTCAHSRAYEYFSESIKISGFKAHLCDDIESYDDGRCLKNHVSYLGQYEVDKELVFVVK